jgi:hypothetical protein
MHFLAKFFSRQSTNPLHQFFPCSFAGTRHALACRGRSGAFAETILEHHRANENKKTIIKMIATNGTDQIQNICEILTFILARYETGNHSCVSGESLGSFRHAPARG